MVSEVAAQAGYGYPADISGSNRRDIAVKRTDAAASTPHHRPPGATDSGTDAVELSSHGLSLQQAHRVVQEASEVREDLVRRARRTLAIGELNLNGNNLAERLIRA